jgi:hypothetical protein
LKKTNSKMLSTVSKLNKFVNNFEKNKIKLFTKENGIYNSNFLFYYYFLLDNSFEDDPYRTIISDYMQKSERYFPGSSYYLIKKFIEKTRNVNNFNYSKNTIKPNEDILKTYLEENCDKQSAHLIQNILSLGGPDATIICDYDNVENITVERKDNTEFAFSIENSLYNVLFGKKTKNKINATIVVADAFIERESDLIPLIEHSKNNSSSLIVICRGITEVATRALKHIMLKNGILVYVFIEKFNHDDPFKLEDFSKTVGTNLITADKMHSLLKDGVECSKTVDNVTVESNKISFDFTNKVLEKEIITQIKNAKNLDLKNYLLKRKKRVTNKKVFVTVPSEMSFLLQTLKDLINSYKNLVKYGATKTSDNKLDIIESQRLTDNLSDNLYFNLKNISYVIKG